jgi:ABC-type transporter Mla subunit MlaD
MTGGALSVPDVGTSSGSTVTGGVDDVTDSYDEATDAANKATEANEKFKGSLMGFDELNILTDNTNKNSGDDGGEDDPTNITPGEGGQLIPEVGELTEGEGPFDKFAEKMKAFIDEVLEPFKNAWELLGDDLKAEWADLQESFKHFCDSLARFLKSVWDNGGKEFVQHMAEIALAVAKAAAEIGGEILDALARLWEHLDPTKNKHTQGFLDALNEVAKKLRDFILGLGDHFESLMANGGQDVLNALGDMFMNFGEAAARALGVVIDALDGLIDHLDPAVNEHTRNALKALADMFHATGQTALDFVSLLESCLVNGGQDMINAFGDMMMNLLQATAEVITTIMESFSALFEYLDPATNEITKHMMKAWEEAFLAIGQAA